MKKDNEPKHGYKITKTTPTRISVQVPRNCIRGKWVDPETGRDTSLGSVVDKLARMAGRHGQEDPKSVTFKPAEGFESSQHGVPGSLEIKYKRRRLKG